MKAKKFHLWTYVRPYRLPFFIACIAIVSENALEISLPFLMDMMLTNGMTMDSSGNYSYDSGTVYTIASIMLIFAISAFFLGLCSSKCTAIAGRGLGHELRKEQYKKIQDFSFDNLDQFRLNSLVTRMTTDVQIISDSFCQVMRPLLRAPFQLIFAITFALTISQELSVIFLIVIPILAILLTIILLLSRPKFYQLQGALDRVNQTTNESLTAVRLIRANAKKDYENQKFEKVNKNVRGIALQAHSLTATNLALINLMTYVCIVSILLIGGKYALDHNTAIMANHIASFLSYTNQTLASLMMISSVFMIFTRSSASLSRVKEVFSAENEIKDNSDSPLKVPSGDVCFDHVFFKYKKDAKEYVLHDINFQIPSGSFVGILGETGSSKSTLVYLIDRFYDASKGNIFLSGYDIKDYSLKELRSQIAISFQSPRLFTGTIRENLLWGNPNASEEDIKKACQISCCYDFIANMPDGFNTMISQGGNNVSGGQRQRLCIARAILKHPKILILDDSFSALDRITESQLKKNLKNDLPDMTKIVISQKVSAIEDADQIIVLNNGRVNNIGNSQFLLQNDPIYQDIYQIQTEGLAS